MGLGGWGSAFRVAEVGYRLYSCTYHASNDHRPVKTHDPTNRLISNDRNNYPLAQISRVDGQTVRSLRCVKVNPRSEIGEMVDSPLVHALAIVRVDDIHQPYETTQFIVQYTNSEQ